MMRMTFLSGLYVLLVLVLAALGSPEAAEIYRYVTSKGIEVFTNWPPLHSSISKKSPLIAPKPLANLSKGHNNSFKRPQDYATLIKKTSDIYGLDPQLLSAIIQVESNFNPAAVSPKGAMGIMQLMPETARLNKVTNPFNPVQNLEGGARHLRYLLDTYGNDIDLVLAAYNAGEGIVNKYGAVPPYPETKNFVTRVKSFYYGTAKVKGTKLYVLKIKGVYMITDSPSYSVSD